MTPGEVLNSVAEGINAGDLDLRNRWGSLTKNGAITLNVNLVKAPEDVIDYIVLHELCHMKIKEHSHHYWDMLHRFMPNYHDNVRSLPIRNQWCYP
jgi:predicted metal-dependent hydrolase